MIRPVDELNLKFEESSNRDGMYSTSYNYQFKTAKTENNGLTQPNIENERKFKT